MYAAAMAQLCHSAKVGDWTRTKVFAIREAAEVVEFLRESLSRQQ
jgi:hypothetical protein